MKKGRLLLVIALVLLLFGCRDRAVEVRNEDDGRLRLDETHTVDFYRGNDAKGADPITDQCLAVLEGKKPESVKAAEGWEFGPGSEIALYHVNGATVRMLRYGDGDQVLLDVELGGNHVLSGGIRVGSTEEELLESFENRATFDFHGYDLEGDTRAYVLYGPWYERYLIFFEVDAATGRITSTSYELDS